MNFCAYLTVLALILVTTVAPLRWIGVCVLLLFSKFLLILLLLILLEADFYEWSRV